MLYSLEYFLMSSSGCLMRKIKKRSQIIVEWTFFIANYFQVIASQRFMNMFESLVIKKSLLTTYRDTS